MGGVTREQVVEALEKVFDPEIPVDVWNLGLVYGVDVEEEEGRVGIRMTLTSEACPAAQQLPYDVRERVMALEGVTSCEVEVVWEPRWTPERISEKGRRILGIDDGQEADGGR